MIKGSIWGIVVVVELDFLGATAFQSSHWDLGDWIDLNRVDT